MTMVLLTVLALIAVVCVWSSVRHRQVVAWDRELDDAFGSRDRRELPRHGHL